MLSVCIPVYNFNVTKLTQELHNQLSKSSIDFEILLFDDFSAVHYKVVNRRLSELDHVVYEEMPGNLGRSKIRNVLANKAKFDYLLFLDSDSKIATTDFISRYLSMCNNEKLIVYGGRKYGDRPEDSNHFLQWYYSVHKNGAPAGDRTLKPHHAFCTNNFLISKKLLIENHFESELIKGWGHEDTLFAYMLKQKGINIIHINNPIIHQGYVTNETFIKQMDQGLTNLARIYLSGKYPDLVNDFRTTRVIRQLEKLGLLPLFQFIYGLIERPVYKNINGGKPKLFLFDVYKLGNLSRAIHREKKKTKKS